MNWQHFQTFIWLRWRLKANQRRRASFLTNIVETFAWLVSTLVALIGLTAGFLIGLLALRSASPATIMLVWDGVTGIFLFGWIGELLTELQRSEMLSLERFLHLPVSLTSVFILNYLGSMYSLASVLFLPAMLGLTIGLVFSHGWFMAFLFPLVAALMLAVTAITYEFRGWLASMMMNKRRRRTIVTLASVVFVLLLQLPNLWNLTTARSNRASASQTRRERQELEKSLDAGKIDRDEYRRRIDAINERNRSSLETTQRTAATVNMVVPFGWVAYGAMGLAERNMTPALLGSLGLALIGVVSLHRSYRTTLRIYTGDFTSGKAGRTTAPAAVKGTVAKNSETLLERKLPRISEHACAVALASFRSLSRAPEAKMLLLSPLIMVVVFGSFILRSNSHPPELLRPLMATGGVAMLFLTMSGLAGNQFGYDRNGFRVFVLVSAPRSDILLGKNLALAPFVLTPVAAVIAGLQYAYPMRVDHFLAVFLQVIPMYLVFCIAANLISILAPIAVPAGSLRPARPKGAAIIVHLAFMILFPLALSTTLIPLGIEFLLSRAAFHASFPAYFVFTLIELALILQIYPRLLILQGTLFQQREQSILEIVTAKSE